MRKKFSVLNPRGTSVLIRALGLFRLRELGFLFRRQMSNDYFAFRSNTYFQIYRHFAMESDGHGVLTNPLQRLPQVNAMTIDLIATLSQSLGQIHRSH